MAPVVQDGPFPAAVDELGLPALPEETIRATIGLGLRETMDELFPEADEDLFQRVVAAYRRRWLPMTRASPLSVDLRAAGTLRLLRHRLPGPGLCCTPG